MKKLTLNKGKDFLVYRLAQGDTVEIDDIAVNSERKKGIGTKLINMLEKEIGQGTKLYAFARHENKIARMFYTKNGFVATTLVNFYPDGSAFLYTKTV